jgi:putative salt-induced outer membrane protein YdiY
MVEPAIPMRASRTRHLLRNTAALAVMAVACAHPAAAGAEPRAGSAPAPGALAPPVPLPPSTHGHPDEVVVRLSTGETLRGVIADRDERSITLRHPVLGPLVIPIAQIAEIRPVVERPRGAASAPPEQPETPVARPALPPVPVPAAPPAPSAPPTPGAPERDVLPLGPIRAEEEPPPPIQPPLLPPGWTPRSTVPAKPPRGPWRATIAAAVNYTDNNDSSIDARIAAGAEYRVAEVETLALGAEFFFQTLNSNTTDNNLLVNGVYDRYIEHTPWLWFLKGQYQYSQFEAWEHRLSAYGGVGYQFLRLPPIDLLLKLGAGGTYEFGPPSQALPEGYGEIQFAWKITDLQRLEMSANVAPDWSNFGEFRIISRAEWQCRIDPSLDLAITMGVRWQYQSQVPAGDTNSDLRVYGGLQLGF